MAKTKDMTDQQSATSGGTSKSWLKPVLIIVGILIILGIILVSPYNSMVTKEEKVVTQWSNVENVYQRKYDLIPNLVSVAKNYAEFEQETLTQVIEARSKATSINIDANNLTPETLQQFEAVQGQLNSALSRLLATFERYPDLKANQLYIELQAELVGSENRISVERNRFNEMAKEYNTYIRKFPNNIVAGLFGFDRKPTFEAEAAAEGGKVDVEKLFDE